MLPSRLKELRDSVRGLFRTWCVTSLETGTGTDSIGHPSACVAMP